MIRRRRLVVVDGSNLATEGRATPSLRQLDEAVRAFADEYPGTEVVVVVDATFEHRVATAERERVKQAELAGEIVTPPAGAIGRGDAFILKIAKRADASVLSNDSFQEFHEEHPWLFEEGRLIGGKPVARVGWIFTPRTPVRAQRKKAGASRAAVAKKPAPEPAPPAAERPPARAAAAKKAPKAAAAKRPAAEKASSPRSTPRQAAKKATGKAPAPPARPASKATPAKAADAKVSEPKPSDAKRPEPVNTVRSFHRLLADHAVGATVDGEVVQFTSHGAMVSVPVGRTMHVVCYAPLAGLGSPPPTKARDVLQKGETYPFSIVSFDADRRRAELALARKRAARSSAGTPRKRGRRTAASRSPAASS